MNIEDFKKETNSRLKFYKDQYVKKLEGVFPHGRRRSSKQTESLDISNGDINQKFKEFVQQIFTKPSEILLQSNYVLQFCKQFGMDRDYLVNLNDFDQKQQYLLSCINQQVQNKTLTDTTETIKLRKCASQKKIEKSWMKMNTKHQYLQGKVRQAFMQALNQQGNQQKIDNYVKEYNQRKNNSSHNSQSPKLKLNKIPDNDPQKLEVLSINWDGKTETKLKQKINKMKNELRDVSYSRKLGRQRYITKEQYMFVAYSEIMRTFNEHKQYNMDRDTILKKYLERQVPLTQNEMKFILNTSPLITKSLNKTKIKTAIQNLDPMYLHSIEIKIADQVLNDFNNSIKQIKKSRKVYKKQTLNDIMNKLHQLQRSQSGNRQSSDSQVQKHLSHYTGMNERVHKTNLIHKYSGGCDSLKKVKDLPKTDNFIKRNQSLHQYPGISSASQFQRPSTALNKSNKTNRSAFNPVSQASQKRKRQLLIKSLQISALRNNFEWVIVQNYPHFSPHEVNVPDKQGNTPLYYVTKTQNQQFCMYLLKCGANVNYVCQKGETPLHMAFKSNNQNIISACLMKTPDLNVVCKKGFTPLAHGKILTLKAFGLMNGVPKCNPNEPRFFDNNRLLTISPKPIQQPQNDLIY